jgi:hypothetical protein
MSLLDALFVGLLAFTDLGIILFMRRRRIRRAMVERVLGRSLKRAFQRNALH